MQGQVAKTSTDANKDATKPAAGKGQVVGKSGAAENTHAAKKSAVPSVDGINLDTLQAFITGHEGVVYHTYADSRGNPTAGIGHLLPAGTALGTPVSKEQVTEWFHEDVATAISGAEKVMGSHFAALNAARKCVIIDMVFNLGEAGFAGFTNTIQMIESGNYAGAAHGMLESLWASQVGHRATQDASIMQSGSLEGAAAPTNGAAPAAGPSGGATPAPTTKPTTKPASSSSASSVLAPIREGHTTLQNGSHGAAVAEVQRLLHITADGDFGPQTEAAVKQFQAAHHLTVDGCVGEHTIDALDPAHASSSTKPSKTAPEPGKTETDPKPTTGKSDPTKGTSDPATGTKPPKGYTAAPGFTAVREGKAEIKEGMAGPSVKYVQQKIGTTADGEFGPDTKSAVELYQETHKIAESGVVGRVTATALWDNKKATGLTPVQWAEKFVNQDSEGLKGLPGYNSDGRPTDNCAEFVSSCLFAAHWIDASLVNASVGTMASNLLTHGWKVVPLKSSVANDVWVCHDYGGIDHTELITANGGVGKGDTGTVGSDGGAVEEVQNFSLDGTESQYGAWTVQSGHPAPGSLVGVYVLHRG